MLFKIILSIAFKHLLDTDVVLWWEAPHVGNVAPLPNLPLHMDLQPYPLSQIQS